MWQYLLLAVALLHQSNCGIVSDNVSNNREKAISINVNGAQIDTSSVGDAINRLIPNPNSICTVDNVQGYCDLSSLNCKLNKGGKVLGSSFIGNTGGCGGGACCEITGLCRDQTNKRISYFKNDPRFTNQNQNSNPSLCEFTINAMNENVCQIRLDFIEFELSPATQAANAPTSAIICRNDFMQINMPNNFQAPTLCGHQDSHMYLPMNASNRETTIRLSMNLVQRNAANAGVLNTARWNIRVRQLECPFKKEKMFPAAEEDFPLLAPPGCLQWYPERTGTICNLFYNRNQPLASNLYPSNLNYAACINRPPNACGIRYKVGNFMMSGTNNMCSYTTDSLTIPGGDLITGNTITPTSTKFCGTMITTTADVISTLAGPWSMTFKTDNAGATSENGYCLIYSIPSSCV